MFAFNLEGNSFDIKILQSFTRKDWDIFERNAIYYLRTPYTTFTTITEDCLESQAHSYLSILNGIAHLRYEDHRNIKLGGLHSFLEDGRILAHTNATMTGRSRMNATLSVSGEAEFMISDMANYRTKAESSTDIQDVLHFFEEPNWWNLYKIYEIIKKDIGGDTNLSALGDKSKIKNFTQTANNCNSIGDESRHANKSLQSNINPISLSEAQDLWRGIIKKWLNSKNNS